jgi:hypothetical protein
MRAILTIVLAALLLAGCTQKEHGVCEAPHSNVTWVYIWESNGMMTQDKCIYCDNSLSDDEVAEWVKNNATSYTKESNGQPKNPTPCLYVYSGMPGVDNMDSAAACHKMVCTDKPNTGDNVQSNHGAWKSAKPILDPDSVALDEAMTTPADGSLLQWTPNTDLERMSVEPHSTPATFERALGDEEFAI